MKIVSKEKMYKALKSCMSKEWADNTMMLLDHIQVHGEWFWPNALTTIRKINEDLFQVKGCFERSIR